MEVFFGNDGDEEVILEHDVHDDAGGQCPGNGRGGIGVFQPFTDASEDGPAGRRRSDGRSLQQENADKADEVEASQEGVDTDGGACELEKDADDEGADDSANAESKLLQGDGLNEVALPDDVEHEGPSAGVVEGTAGSANTGCDEEEVRLDSPKQEDNQHRSYNGQRDEVGSHDDVSAVLAVADGAGEEGEGEHGDGAAESDEGHLPGGAGNLVDEPSHGEELGHIPAGRYAAVGQQILEVPVSDDV